MSEQAGREPGAAEARRIRDELREVMLPLIVRDPALAAEVIPAVQAKALELVKELGQTTMPSREMLGAMRTAAVIAREVTEGTCESAERLIAWLDSLESEAS